MNVTEPIGLDLLIVGGGIQGLTLLHHYTEGRRGSAMLVTRDALGKGETLHSHGYLHKGHFLPPEEARLIPAFVESFQWWDAWMSRNGIDHEDGSSVYFDVPDERYEETTGIWKRANLPFETPTELPAVLQGGVYSRPDLGRRLVRIHDRLIAPWRMVKALSDPLQDLLMQGEVTEISWDPETNRVTDCVVETAERSIRFRPDTLVLATGRDTQSLLGKITGPQGTRPFLEKSRNLHRIRDVPMILIEGASLPSLSGWFFAGSPIAMMSHTAENGERMWVATLMEGHHTGHEDFEDRPVEVDGAVIRDTLLALRKIVPDLKNWAGQLRFRAYVGSKIDHPEARPTWFIGDGGIENLRFVWPVLWGLADAASRALIRDLSESSRRSSSKGERFDASGHGLPTGLEVGEEERLSRSRQWHTLDDWERIHDFRL